MFFSSGVNENYTIICAVKTEGLLVLVPLRVCKVSKNTVPFLLRIGVLYFERCWLEGKTGPKPSEKLQSGLMVGPSWAGEKHSDHLTKESEM